jgi:hypothetical protein
MPVNRNGCGTWLKLPSNTTRDAAINTGDLDMIEGWTALSPTADRYKISLPPTTISVSPRLAGCLYASIFHTIVWGCWCPV